MVEGSRYLASAFVSRTTRIGQLDEMKAGHSTSGSHYSKKEHTFKDWRADMCRDSLTMYQLFGQPPRLSVFPPKLRFNT